MYKEYVTSFSPNLNQNQILLYIYKQFFNVKNVSFTNEYSQQLIKMLTTDIILRFMREKIQGIMEQEKNHCLLVDPQNTNHKEYLEATITEKSLGFESDEQQE